MRRVFGFVLIGCFVLAGCSYDTGGGDKRVVAQINKYKMTADDLRYELGNVPYDNMELLGTKEGRQEYIDSLVDKELLLQEAQHQGLDREKDFMKSIESYWEQTLLKLLLERKSKEISGLVHVYDNEIDRYYKNSGEIQPLSRVKKEIASIIEDYFKKYVQNNYCGE